MNFEINCYLYDRSRDEQNKQHFLADMAECEEVIREQWITRA